MKAKFLKIAGVKTEEEFYEKYPTEESFFAEHSMDLPEMAMGGDPQTGIYPGLLPQFGFGNTPYGAPMSNPGVGYPEMEWGDPSDVERFEPGASTPAAQGIPDLQQNPPQDGRKLRIKDYLNAGAERLQRTSDKFMAQYNNPTSAINILGYGASIADHFDNKEKQRKLQKFYQGQFNSDNMFATVPASSGDRGDYSNTGSSYGQFRPNQMGSQSPYGMAFGGEGPGPDDPIFKRVAIGRPKPRPYQPDITLPGWDGMVQKADGSIGFWGNDWRDIPVIPTTPGPPPEAYTDHNGRRSGSYYQGQPNADAKIQAIRERLIREAAAAPMKRYKKGGQYTVSPEELGRLLASGAEIEFI